MSAIKLVSNVVIPEAKFKISYDSPLLLVGSCFAQNIGKKLTENKLGAMVNPFGIIYNPISIANSLTRIINNQFYSENELKKSDSGEWISFDHHGGFSGIDKTGCLAQINTAISNAYTQIKKAKIGVITFGTAWVYEYEGIGVVANCHKMPSKKFNKRLLEVSEIIERYNDFLIALKNNHPEIQIIFTVSPVRHIKDGVYENNLSKGTLHLAVKSLMEQHEFCSYFPAYEIMIDELRDYRFFRDDLVHPTALAINYIWERFVNTYCDEKTKELISSIQKLRLAVQHRPFNFESDEHQKFISKQIQLMNQLSQQYPFLDFEEEKDKINSC